MSGLSVILCAIQLTGVTGSDLRARAFFDANNVKVGDPLVLTIDFLGEADFKALHPPALSKSVNRRNWKLDDISAKTDTFSDARRLVYRVRPMREGVLWFPPLEFEYAGKGGERRLVRSNEIPVHAKVGAQVVVKEMSEDRDEMPKPPELVAKGAERGVRLASDDERFRWRKALSRPTADAFAAFDFPAAQMNEATCAIREGNWARALQIYRRLEWRIGQTPEMERGILAALALRHDNPAVELPVWRQVLRPILRYGWMGRVGLVFGGLMALAVVFWLLGRIIRAFACVALIASLAATASAETIETVVTNADGSIEHRKVIKGRNGNVSFSFTSSSSSGMSMPRTRGGFGGSLFDMMENFNPFGMNRRRTSRLPVSIDVWLESDKPSVVIGEDFNLILSIDQPRYVSFADGLQLAIDEQEFLEQTDRGRALRDVASRNPTNVVKRLVFPMRVKRPFDGPLHFSVGGGYTLVGDDPFFGTTRSYSSGKRTAGFAVAPLPTEGRPPDFSGIISSDACLHEYCDLLRVETNDVVTITYKFYASGYVPAGYLPKTVAFEWARNKDASGPYVLYRRYFVADGTARTPRFAIPYYDPKARKYKTAQVDGTELKYDIMRDKSTDRRRE